MQTANVRFVKELYPRLKPSDDAIERYRAALELLPPIVVARDGILVDGYHRWQAHVRDGIEEIECENLGDIPDSVIIHESFRRNASHGMQLSQADKKRHAGWLWLSLVHLSKDERHTEIEKLLSVNSSTVDRWTKNARAEEKRAQQDKAWDMWLDCHTQEEIAAAIVVTDQTIKNWNSNSAQLPEFREPPESRQHFDIWNFQHADKDAGQQSYFGAIPPQVIENLLWFWTDPGQIIVDLFAGSGTTIDVAKSMGRRVWASDRIGNRYSPHLPIHQHDALSGWPSDAPSKADLIFLDPPYWQQAKGKYSDDDGDLGNQSIDEFYASWTAVIKACMKRSPRIAYIISPTQLDDGSVVDHATDMLEPFIKAKWKVERRVIVPYQTQQATGQQVEWAREKKRMLKLYRDLVIVSA